MTKELIIYSCHKSRVSRLCVCVCVCDRLYSRVEGFDDGVDKRAWGGCFRVRPLEKGANHPGTRRREATIREQNLNVCPRRDGLLAFLNLLGGHGLRVVGLHDVAVHIHLPLSLRIAA